MVDVQLMGDDGDTVPAHQLILAHVSPYLRQLLRCEIKSLQLINYRCGKQLGCQKRVTKFDTFLLLCSMARADCQEDILTIVLPDTKTKYIR